MGSQPIGGIKLEIGGDIKALREAVRDGKVSVEELGKFLEQRLDKSTTSAERSVSRLVKELTAVRPNAQMNQLLLAVEKLGGVSKLSETSVGLLERRVQGLVSQGAQLPPVFQGLTRATEGLGAAVNSIRTEGLQRLNASAAQLGPLGGALSAVGPAGMLAAAGIGAMVAAGSGLGKIIGDAATWAASTKDTARALGTTTDAVQRLEHAADATKTPFEKVTGAILKMQTQLQEAPALFERIGLSLAELDDMAPEDQFFAVGEALAKIEDPALRNAMAIKILGKSWEDLAPMVMQGKSAMDGANVISADSIEKLDELKGKANLLEKAWDNLWKSMGAALASTNLVDNIQLITDALDKLTTRVQKGGLSELLRLGGPSGDIAANAIQYIQKKGIMGAAAASGLFPFLHEAAAPPETMAAAANFPGIKAAASGEGRGRPLSNEATREAIRLEQEYQRAVGDTGSALDRTLAKIQASTQAKLQEITSSETLTKSEKGLLTTLVKRNEEVEIRSAKAASARKVEQIAIENRAKAEQIANETIQAGMTALEQQLHAIEAKRRAEVDAAHATLDAAEREGELTQGIIDSANARIIAANAMAKEASEQLKLKAARELELNSMEAVDRARAAFIRSSPAISGQYKVQRDEIELTAASNSKKAEADYKAGKISKDALDQVTEAWRRFVDEGVRNLNFNWGSKWFDAFAQSINYAGDALVRLGVISADGKVAGGLKNISAGLGGVGQMIKAGPQAMAGDPTAIASMVQGGITSQLEAFDFGRKNLAGVSKGGLAAAAMINPFTFGAAAVGGMFGKKDRSKALGAAGDMLGSTTGFGAVDEFNKKLAQGGLSAKELASSFDAAFNELIPRAISKTTGLLDKNAESLIKIAKANGIASEAIQALMRDQAMALAGNLAGGLAQMKERRQTVAGEAGARAERRTREQLAGSGLSEEEVAARIRRAGNRAADEASASMGLVSQRAATAIGTSIVGAFNQMLEQGLSRGEAFEKIRPSVEAFREELRIAGYEGGAAFAVLDEQITLFGDKVTGPILEGIGSFGGAMANLNNLGLGSKEVFAGLAEQIGASIGSLEQQGVSQQAILAAIQPQLQMIWELQQKYGFEVDATTQRYIDLGLKQKKIGAEFMGDGPKMQATMERVATAVERMADALERGEKGAIKLDTALSRLQSKTITVQTNYTTSGGGGGGGGSEPPDKGGNDIPEYATGSGGIRNFGGGTMAMLHGFEGVYTADQLNSMLSTSYAAGAAISAPMSSDFVSPLVEEIRGLREDNARLRDAIKTGMRDTVTKLL